MSGLVDQSNAAIAQGSQSFALAARLLPKSIRDDTVMLYAWCRYADDVIDGQVMGHEGQALDDPKVRLDELRENTARALHSDAPLDAPFEALRSVARRHDMPEAWPMDLIDGFEMDVCGRHYEKLGDTLEYAYHVAGVVGLMMARVMGVKDEDALDRACDLGIAFQLTNIARDVMDDARMDRVYLPQEWLAAEAATITEDLPSPALYKVILRLLDTAESYYQSARLGYAALPLQAAWSIASAARIYRAIGGEIRKQGSPGYEKRIHTSTLQKCGLIAQASFDLAAMRRPQAPVPRDGLWTRRKDAS